LVEGTKSGLVRGPGEIWGFFVSLINEGKIYYLRGMETAENLPIAFPEFDAVLPLIQSCRVNFMDNSFWFEIVIPWQLRLDIEKVKAYFRHDLELHFSDRGWTSLTGTFRDSNLGHLLYLRYREDSSSEYFLE
jgi:hypothetical protein